jgi:hypothetical protein
VGRRRYALGLQDGGRERRSSEAEEPWWPGAGGSVVSSGSIRLEKVLIFRLASCGSFCHKTTSKGARKYNYIIKILKELY